MLGASLFLTYSLAMTIYLSSKFEEINNKISSERNKDLKKALEKDRDYTKKRLNLYKVFTGLGVLAFLWALSL